MAKVLPLCGPQEICFINEDYGSATCDNLVINDKATICPFIKSDVLVYTGKKPEVRDDSRS